MPTTTRDRQPRWTHRSAFAALSVSALLVGVGCAGSTRTDLSLDDGLTLPAFAIDAEGPDAAAAPAPEGVALDRSGWTQRSLLVPATNVRTYTNIRAPIATPSQTASQRGQYPSRDNALEPETRDHARESREQQALEGPLAYIGAGLDLALAPFRWLDAGLSGANGHAPAYPYERIDHRPHTPREPVTLLPQTDLPPELQISPPYDPLPGEDEDDQNQP